MRKDKSVFNLCGGIRNSYMCDLCLQVPGVYFSQEGERRSVVMEVSTLCSTCSVHCPRNWTKTFKSNAAVVMML